MAPLDGTSAASVTPIRSRRRRQLPWRVAPAFQGVISDEADGTAAKNIQEMVGCLIGIAIGRGMTPYQTASELAVSLVDPRTILVMSCAIDRAHHAGGSHSDIADAVLGAVTAEDPGFLRAAILSERNCEERRKANAESEAGQAA